MSKIRFQNQKGVGLLELLIYCVLSVVVLTSIYQLLDNNRATYASGESKMAAQQNARVGMDEIDRELRMTGYFPENFDADGANNITFQSVQVATDRALAVAGDADATGATNVFLFCLDGTVLRRQKGTNGVLATYTCSSGETLAENVTSLRFTYYDANNASIPATPTPPFALDTQAANILPTYGSVTERSAVRRVVMAITVRKDVPPKGSQIYTLTSDVRLRNLN
jgi:type II secretory pathway component PulJ